MNKYFRMVKSGQHFFGIIENLPNSISDEKIKERIQSTEGEDWIMIVDEEFEIPDIVIDWESIDYVTESDNDMMAVLDAIEISTEHDTISEVVYTALKNMKENSNLSISEAINIGLNEWVK